MKRALDPGSEVRGAMEGKAGLNESLLNFFMDNYRPASIGLVGTRDPVGLAIRQSLRALREDGKPSSWSHCFLLGDLRWDRRGPQRGKSRSLYIFESDIQISLYYPQLRNGAQESWVGKWCTERVENAAVVDFELTEAEREDVLSFALQLVDEQAYYPLQELIGTWWSIISKRQWQPNWLDDPHALYCSAFVRHCYREAGKDFGGAEVSLSNTTPEDIAQRGIESGKLLRFLSAG